MSKHTVGAATVLLIIALGAGVAANSQETGVQEKSMERAQIEKLLADYIDLYSGPTLETWKMLFHPSLLVASPRPDGSINVRSLEEFFAAQKSYFATGRKISERLENVRIAEGRRIARVTADFIFVDEGQERRGKLGLHLVRANEGWKIVAILFSYDRP